MLYTKRIFKKSKEISKRTFVLKSHPIPKRNRRDKIADSVLGTQTV